MRVRTRARTPERPHALCDALFSWPPSLLYAQAVRSFFVRCVCLPGCAFFFQHTSACVRAYPHTRTHTVHTSPLTPRVYYWSMDASAAELLPCERACVDEFFHLTPPSHAVRNSLPACLFAYQPPPPTPPPRLLLFLCDVSPSSALATLRVRFKKVRVCICP